MSSVKVRAAYLPIVRAIAVTMTEEYEQAEEPFTEAQVLEDALLQGLLEMEREYLGTRSLDPNAPEPGDCTPETTAAMRALVKACAGAARSSPSRKAAQR